MSLGFAVSQLSCFSIALSLSCTVSQPPCLSAALSLNCPASQVGLDTNCPVSQLFCIPAALSVNCPVLQRSPDQGLLSHLSALVSQQSCPCSLISRLICFPPLDITRNQNTPYKCGSYKLPNPLLVCVRLAGWWEGYDWPLPEFSAGIFCPTRQLLGSQAVYGLGKDKHPQSSSATRSPSLVDHLRVPLGA